MADLPIPQGIRFFTLVKKDVERYDADHNLLDKGAGL